MSHFAKIYQVSRYLWPVTYTARLPKPLSQLLLLPESRDLNAKLINPKECLDFLAGCWRRVAEATEGGKAFRSLSALPSRMPYRNDVWSYQPAVYTHVSAYTNAGLARATSSHEFSSVRIRCTQTRGYTRDAHHIR